jgi:hypothetical protein
MAFKAVDFPEFERPTNATSRPSSGGNPRGSAALVMKVGVPTAGRSKSLLKEP